MKKATQVSSVVERKSLWVSEGIHRKVKIMACKEDLNIMKFLEKVINEYEAVHHPITPAKKKKA